MGYGPGTDYTINTNKPFGVITEFRERDGELDGMYQYYLQNGKTIHPPDYGFGSDNVMDNDFCKKVLSQDGEKPYFFDHGGMPQFSKAVKKGMTMVTQPLCGKHTLMHASTSGMSAPARLAQLMHRQCRACKRLKPKLFEMMTMFYLTDFC